MATNEYMKKRMEDILAGRPIKTKEKKPLNKVSPKRAEKIAKEKIERGDDDTELQKWYRNRVKHMTGYCAETHLRTETKVFQYAIMSICHILPKSTCPSVATHPMNFIELIPDFHTKFDAMSWEEREKMGCWPIIHDRLIHVYESLDPSERRHFPPSVLKFIEENDLLK